MKTNRESFSSETTAISNNSSNKRDISLNSPNSNFKTEVKFIFCYYFQILSNFFLLEMQILDSIRPLFLCKTCKFNKLN